MFWITVAFCQLTPVFCWPLSSTCHFYLQNCQDWKFFFCFFARYCVGRLVHTLAHGTHQFTNRNSHSHKCTHTQTHTPNFCQSQRDILLCMMTFSCTHTHTSIPTETCTKCVRMLTHSKMLYVHTYGHSVHGCWPYKTCMGNNYCSTWFHCTVF